MPGEDHPKGSTSATATATTSGGVSATAPSSGGSGGGGSLNVHSAGGGRRPVKVWNSARTIRKALVVATYEEFQRKGREKLGLGASEPLRVVLEGDGTQVDDGEYFQTLPGNSVFLFLRSGEAWHPAGTDSVRSAVMDAIPTIVCETLYAMGLHDQTPSWKIMDNKGRITVVLHWERDGPLPLTGPSRQSSTCSTIAAGGPRLLGRSGSSVSSTPCLSRDNSRASTGAAATAIQHSMLVQTSFDSHLPSSGYGIHHHLITKDGASQKTLCYGPHITVINHDADSSPQKSGSSAPSALIGGAFLGPPGRVGMITGAPSPHQLSRQGSSVESGSTVPIHQHTAECSGAGRSLHQPTHHSKRGSPTSNECDFHCCSLHAGQSSHKTVATSPIQAMEAVQDGKRSLPKGAHVRFSNVEIDGGAQATTGPVSSTASATTATLTTNGVLTSSTIATTTATSVTSFHCVRDKGISGLSSDVLEASGGNGNDSSESETENNDDLGTSVKFLLLVDQLSMDQPDHLSIKDIGIILERLNSKIIDVERLDRSAEGSDTHNWTLKATIRGDVMRELGVIYNNNYYAISEHPGYSRDDIGDDDDAEDDYDDEDNQDSPPPVPKRTSSKMGDYQLVYCHKTMAGHFHYHQQRKMQPTAVQHTIGIHVKGSGNGVANDRHNTVMAESRLQWSSDSTLGASPTMAENGKRMLKYHQLHHHHHHLHHYYHRQPQTSNESTSSAQAPSSLSAQSKTNGVNAAEGEGCSGCAGLEENLEDNDSDVDVCAQCSEWLSKALLCSCQVPSSSESSSPSQCNTNIEQRRRQAGSTVHQS